MDKIAAIETTEIKTNSGVIPALPIESDVPPAAPIPEPMSGAEVADFIAEIYPIAGNRLGSHLVESNIVLTLAGARGQTEFFIPNPIAEDNKKIEELNETLLSKGIRIHLAGNTFKSPTTGEETQMVNLESLRGYDRASRLTTIPGITPFSASEGWEGLRKWNLAIHQGLEKAHADGKLPYDKKYLGSIFATGVFKGYPDQAIHDMAAWLQNKSSYQLAETHIAHTGIYEEAQPNFAFAKEHKDDRGIQRTVDKWGKLLGDFYASSWHQKIKQDPQFVQARKPLDAPKPLKQP